MSVFNSLGSNYSTKHLLHMVSGFNPADRDKFVAMLEKRYDANVQLTYKGREALFLALKRLELKPGDHVAVNGYTCYAVYDAVTSAGLVPVYVDVGKNSLNFSEASLKKVHKKDKKIKAVIVQNTLGYPADIKKIESYAHKNKIHLVEDLAHSIGMKYGDGREAGTVADAALSFSQDKVVDSVSGGALIYRGKPTKFKTRRLRYTRFLKDYYYIFNTLFIRSGYIWGGGKIYAFALRKSRLMPRPMDGKAWNVRRPDVWHATLAFKQLNDLDKSLKHRQNIASIYRQNLQNKIKLPHVDEAIYLRFPLQVNDPASLVGHLKSKGIYVSDTWYDAPIGPRKCMSDTNYKDGSCPNAENIASRMVNLPTHINVDVHDAEKITAGVNEWLSNQE